MSKTIIGFIGTGIMGHSMADHLLKAGHPVQVFSRTKEKAESLLSAGATWKSTPQAVAVGAGIVITIVGFPKDVEEVYLAPDGVIAGCAAGTIVIDMTTSSPALAEKIAAAAAEKGAKALDAPVSGGDVGAREARLAIMVGGDKATFDEALPIFQIMGKNIAYQGKVGAGQHTKMCNQIGVAAGVLGVCEALAYAKANGLNQQTVLDTIAAGAAGSWSLSNLGPRVLKGDFNPGFMIKHFRKDLGIALEAARAANLNLPMTNLAADLYAKLATKAGEELGTQALYQLYSEAL